MQKQISKIFVPFQFCLISIFCQINFFRDYTLSSGFSKMPPSHACIMIFSHWSNYFKSSKAVAQRYSFKKDAIFNKVAGWRPTALLRETRGQVFYCEFWEIFKNNFFTEHLWVIINTNTNLILINLILII